MEEFEDFEAVFGTKSDVAYDPQTIEEIVDNRRALENVLFLDRLLGALGIEKSSKLYPPRSAQDLRNLHEQIVSSQSPDHHKQSVLYYLLKEVAHSSRQATEKFANVSHLPETYKIFIDGIWYLDRLKFERALEYLTEPGLIPTYPEEILYALCRHAPENDNTLPLAYYYTVSPIIASTKVLEAFFFILCRSSVTEALFFSRQQGEFIHHDLFEKLIEFVLIHSKGTVRAQRGVELISLPLDDVEIEWFEHFLKDGKGKTLSGARDTIIMRELAKGEVAFLRDGKKVAGHKVAGVNWATLRENLTPGFGVDNESHDAIMS